MCQSKNMEISKSIDSLKGIAMLGILLVHSQISFSGNFEILNCVVNNGARGVQLMFILNGYLIFKSLDHAYQKGISTKEWYKKKALRIIPLYWIFTLLHLLVFGRGERFYLGPLKEVSVLNIVCNLLCIHGFFPYYVNSINVNWFIADLMIWYLIAPLAYKLIGSMGKALRGILFIIPSIYCALMLIRNYPIISSEPIWNDYVTILSILPELPVIILGCTIYLIEKEGRIQNKEKWTSCAFYFFAIIGLALLIIGSDKFMVFSNIFSYAICFAMLFVAQMINPVHLLCNKILAMFGRHSYSIYLSHVFVIAFIWKFWNRKQEQLENIKSAIIYVAICVLSLVVAVCIDKIYENIVKLVKSYKIKEKSFR